MIFLTEISETFGGQIQILAGDESAVARALCAPAQVFLF